MEDREASGNRGEATRGASMVVLRRDAVLMVERSRAPNQGKWSFPAGRAEPGEDAEANARRELFEETGLRVGAVVRLGEFTPEGSAFRITVFAARAGEGEPKVGDDAAKAEFVPFSHVLTRPLTAGAAGWIARAIAALADTPRR
ncbi:MAG: NUDIX domain-containing protein [Propylenella sp.]